MPTFRVFCRDEDGTEFEDEVSAVDDDYAFHEAAEIDWPVHFDVVDVVLLDEPVPDIPL